MLQWDFSDNRVYRYDYEQKVVARFAGDLPHDSSKGESVGTSSKGTLFVKGQADRTARLVLQDVETTMEIESEKEGQPTTMAYTAPLFVLQGMKEDGTLKTRDARQEMFVKLLFPLPPKALKVGESLNVASELPFDAMGSRLMATGRLRISLTDYVRIGRRTCAQLETDIDISRVDVPPELQGKYACFARGASVTYFDIEDRCFVSGRLALLIGFDIEAPAPGMQVAGEEVAEQPGRMRMSAESDNLIVVTTAGDSGKPAGTQP